MNGNRELVNFIYQNSKMGIEVLDKLISITKNSEFNKCLLQALQ